MEMVRLMKWASSWEKSCLDVSKSHILQGRRGCSLYLLMISIEKERMPRLICMRTPTRPTMSQLLFYELSSFMV